MRLKAAELKSIDEVMKSGKIPAHIAIIMDGNGRWAKKRALPRVAGHQKGVAIVREMVEACANLGVKVLTLYTFSTENWNRPQEEVSTLMRLIVKSLQIETNELHSNNIKLTTIGNTKLLPSIVQDELDSAMEKTINNTAMTLNLALSYSGRWELTEAVKNITKQVLDNKLNFEDITEKTISDFLSTAAFPDPDLLIRSGGEQRISNFLLWQIAYSEIYITDTLWPDFKTKNLLEAIKSFQKRERRFGLVSEQLSNGLTKQPV
ncbi:MAG: isoprenyl transferase [Melioribacteraceae bacterium]|nr:isoprenyl transferase [Melioribacteraceae bacterium]